MVKLAAMGLRSMGLSGVGPSVGASARHKGSELRDCLKVPQRSSPLAVLLGLRVAIVTERKLLFRAAQRGRPGAGE
jgi:hypothetical protein